MVYLVLLMTLMKALQNGKYLKEGSNIDIFNNIQFIDDAILLLSITNI